MTTQSVIESDAIEQTAVQETDEEVQENSLYFFPEAAPFRTPFRDVVCREIFRKARELAGDEFDGGNVTPQQFPGDDEPYLLVTLFVKAEYERRSRIDIGLARHISEISKDWSSAEELDCRKRVHFDVFPAGS